MSFAVSQTLLKCHLHYLIKKAHREYFLIYCSEQKDQNDVKKSQNVKYRFTLKLH